MTPPPAAAPPPPSERSIHARRLTRIHTGGAVPVTGIDGIDLAVAGGQLLVLKGESGSGKSTLLSLLAGLDTPTRGELTVAGRDLNRRNEAELTDFRCHAVGLIFQAFNLLPTLDRYIGKRSHVDIPNL